METNDRIGKKKTEKQGKRELFKHLHEQCLFLLFLKGYT